MMLYFTGCALMGAAVELHSNGLGIAGMFLMIHAFNNAFSKLFP